MIKMDGDEAVKKIREMGIDIPIIAITANVSEMEMQRYYKIGFNGCVGKPIDEKHLKLTIDQVTS